MVSGKVVRGPGILLAENLASIPANFHRYLSRAEKISATACRKVSGISAAPAAVS
jgi:hypothetical protein